MSDQSHQPAFKKDIETIIDTEFLVDTLNYIAKKWQMFMAMVLAILELVLINRLV